MSWADLMLTAGLVVGLAGIVLLIRQVGRRRSWTRASSRPRSAWYVEGVGDLACQALLVGGLVLMQLGTLARHIVERTLPTNLGLSVVASTAILVLFGIAVGRLSMRWQLRSLLAEIDAEGAQSGRTS